MGRERGPEGRIASSSDDDVSGQASVGEARDGGLHDRVFGRSWFAREAVY